MGSRTKTPALDDSDPDICGDNDDTRGVSAANDTAARLRAPIRVISDLPKREQMEPQCPSDVTHAQTFLV